MSGIAFKPEEARDSIKEYTGQIVATDYSEKPFGMEGAAEIKRTGKVLCLKIKANEYEKEQFEWYPPSKVKKTKWLFLIEALIQTGAMKDINPAGATDDERMKNFGQSLLGMKFKWEEKECESLVKLKGGEQKKFDVLLPIEYLGKSAIEAPQQVKQTTIGEELK